MADINQDISFSSINGSDTSSSVGTATNQSINFLPTQQSDDLKSQLNDIIYKAGRSLLTGNASLLAGNTLAQSCYKSMIEAGLGGGGGGVGTVVPTFVTGQAFTLNSDQDANFVLVPLGNNVYQIDCYIPRGKDAPEPTFISGTTISLPEGSQAEFSINRIDVGKYEINSKIPKGDKGDKGFSPIAVVTKDTVTGTSTISVTDENGTTTEDVLDGYSPSARVDTITGGVSITITDKSGTTTENVMDGPIGPQGFSPVVSITPISGGNQIDITDSTTTHTVNVMDGITPNFSINTVNQVEYGKQAVSITENPANTYNLDFDIPAGFCPKINVKQTSSYAIIDFEDVEKKDSVVIYNGSDALDRENWYSTSLEDLIGVWIDSKPLYHFSYKVNLTNGTSGIIANLSSVGIETIVRIYGMIHEKGDSNNSDKPINNDSSFKVYRPANSNMLTWEASSAQKDTTVLEVTIEYTKTSDVATTPSLFDPVQSFESALI